MTAAVELLDAEPLVITAPGVYDIPAEVYHADPVPGGSLSSTGARKLLPPSCPALYRHWADNPPQRSTEFDIGHAAHQLVLGAGPELVVVDAPDWRTKAAKEARAAAYEAGQVPLLPHEHAMVVAMAAALRRHPLAAALLDPQHGVPERTVVWDDPATGVVLRAMLDWLRREPGRRPAVVDYKTCLSVAPDQLERAMYSYGYHRQAPWYLDGVQRLGLVDADVVFLFVAQEKTPPYLVTVFEPDPDALAIGADLNRQAIELYAECVAHNTWPGYSTGIERIGLPRWATRQYTPQEIW